MLQDACRFFEFRVLTCDDRDERTRIEAEVVHAESLRDFFGFNRAKHAVVEAAILATRTDFLPLEDIEAEFRKLAVLVQKTGGEREATGLRIPGRTSTRRAPEATMMNTCHHGKPIALRPVQRARSDLASGARQFGGVGLMVEQPSLAYPCARRHIGRSRVPVRSGHDFSPKDWCRHFGIDESFEMQVESCPPEHVGLGTGTQLSLAIALAMTRAAGRDAD